MTYNDWYQDYLSLYKRNLRPKTLESYSRIHALLSPLIGELNLSDIMPDDIQRALLEVSVRAGSRQAQIAYALLHAVFRRAVRSRHLDLSPVDAIDVPDHVPTLARSISDSDWQLLRPVLLDDPAFALMAFCGLRRGEVLGLRRADVDFGSGLLHVVRQRVRVNGRYIVSPPKSRAGVRSVPLPAVIVPLLRAAVRPLLPNAYIVPCSPESLNSRWRSAQLRAGVSAPYRLHDLRHSYISRLVLDGVPPRVAQYVAGHASLSVTMSVYSHIGPQEALRAFSRLADSLQ